MSGLGSEFVTPQELPGLLSVLVEDTRLAGRVLELSERVVELEGRLSVVVGVLSERGWLE